MIKIEENFQEVLFNKTKKVEAVLQKYLPKETGYQKTILEAMNYSLTIGGKRLRPILMLETYQLFGGNGKEIEPFLAAIEMIHTYSLVHDDLPAMDNDEYRRGHKTTHIVYGEGMAVLAGDALLNYAYETALQALGLLKKEEQQKYFAVIKALQIIAKKAGVYGMIGGQTADIEAEGQKEPLTMEQLVFIHEHKTAALIQAAMMAGAVLAGAKEEEIKQIEKCAYYIGIAFQIQDDILDVIGSSEELGKQVGSDKKNQKQTYVTIKGMEKSKEEVQILSQKAISILDGLKGENSFLNKLIYMLTDRHK